MTQRPLTVAIIGCGKFAEEQVKEIRRLDGTDVIAACDKEELMAEQFAERHDIRHIYTSVEKMCGELRPDVVHIVTPPQTHLQIGRVACEHGSHIYVEKPFTVDYSEAVQLIDAANANARKLTVGHIYHFDPPALEMRKLVRAGILGDPIHIEAAMGYDLEREYGKAFLSNEKHWIYNLPGGLFQNVISHLVERVLEFAPDEAPSVRVFSCLRNRTLKERQLKLLDELRVILGWNSVTASLTFSCNLRPVNSLLRIFGTKNTLDVDLTNRTVVVRRGKQFPTALGRLITEFGLAWQFERSAFRNCSMFLRSDFQPLAGMNYLLNSFYSSIREGNPPPIRYKDILRTSKIMDMIFEQLPSPLGEQV